MRPSRYSNSSSPLGTSLAYGIAANALGALAAAAVCLNAPVPLLIGVLSGALAGQLGLFLVFARSVNRLRRAAAPKTTTSAPSAEMLATRILLRFARRAGRSRDAAQVNRRLTRALQRTFPDASWQVVAVGSDLNAAVADLDEDTEAERIHDLLGRMASSAVPDGFGDASFVGTLAGTTSAVISEDDTLVATITELDRIHLLVLGKGRPWTPTDVRLAELFVETAASAQRNATLLDAALREEKLADLGRLTASVAHELNNPLTFLGGNLQVLAERLDGELGETAKDALWGAKRIVRIVGELSAINRGGQTPELERVDLVRVVEGAVRLSRGKAGFPECEIVGASTLPLDCDVGRTEQTLVNLITNAADAVRHAVRPKIVIRLGVDGENATIRIEDNGPGIPSKVRTRLFDAFVTSKGSAGTGLGLYLARTFVEAQSGRLSVEKTGENGTTFLITLPRGTAASESIAPDKAVSASHRPRILIIDDEPEAVRSLMRLISSAADVVGTTEPDEGLRLATTRPFSAILCDLHMRPFDGSTFIKRLRETDPGQADRVIIVTGAPDDAVKGLAPILTKPVDKELLHRTVAEMKARFHRAPAVAPPTATAAHPA